MLTPERAVTRTTHLGVSPHLPSDKEIYLLRDYRPTFITFAFLFSLSLLGSRNSDPGTHKIRTINRGSSSPSPLRTYGPCLTHLYRDKASALCLPSSTCRVDVSKNGVNTQNMYSMVDIQWLLRYS